MTYVSQLSLLATAYFITGWLGLQIPYTGAHITLVWLPTGVAVAALLVWGNALWPAIALASFSVNLIVGSTLTTAVGIAVGNTLAPVLAAVWLRYMGFRRSLIRQRDIALIVAAACLGMTVSATGGVLNLLLAGALGVSDAISAWLTWWMGDAVGVLLAAPFLMTLSRSTLEQLVERRREVFLWLLVAVPTAWIAFVYEYEGVGHSSLPLAFLTLPCVAWAALSFGSVGAAIAGLFFSVIAAIGTGLGHGSFYVPDFHVSLFLQWSYMVTVVVMGLLVTALQAERKRAEQTLRRSEEKLRGLYELSPLGIALTDMSGRYVEFNEAFRQICGYSEDELKALDYWALTPKRYEAEEVKQLQCLEKTGCYGPYEKEYRNKEGQLVPLRLNGMLISGADGGRYIWSIVEDISDRKRIEADLQIAATAFEAQVGIIVTNAEGIILRVNRAFCDDTGYSAEDVVGMNPRILKSGRHSDEFYSEMWAAIRTDGVWQGEIWDRRKNGEVYPKWMTLTAIKNPQGVVTHYVSTQIDITDRKAAEDEIKSLAFYDPLTRLPNRRLLVDRLRQALATSARNERHGALLFVDLDNFKTLNDTRGHDLGDCLLQLAGERLSSSVREGDTVARLGGDEFVVMLEDLSGSQSEAAGQAEVVAEKVLAALRQSYTLMGHEYRSSASIGIALFGIQHQAMDELMKQADLAMYQAKSAGRNCLRFYDPATQAAMAVRAAMEADLHDAVQGRQFVLYYQPQVDAAGTVQGAEVLVRWKHPQRGLVFPDQFISLAEETGQILDIGDWVLESACAQLFEWAKREETQHLALSVNVSIQQMYRPDFVDRVRAVLARTGANPQRLKLELTESSLLTHVEETIAKMTALKAMGVSFALDDFGTGYSSLTYLKQLPLNVLKIDRSFVMDVLVDPNDAAIARTIVALASTLGLSVIAEGVETVEQREFLAESGCYTYQGYLFSKPVPLADFEVFLLSSLR